MPDIGHFSDDSDSESFHSFSDGEPSPPPSPQPWHRGQQTTFGTSPDDANGDEQSDRMQSRALQQEGQGHGQKPNQTPSKMQSLSAEHTALTDDMAPPPSSPKVQSKNSASRRPKDPVSKSQDEPSDVPPKPVIERFAPEEEASLLAESNSLKGNANQLFGKGSWDNAIQTYDRALSSCPNYLDFEIAVLRSNVAACYLKLEEWKDAITSAEKGVECLERLEPLPQPERKKTKGEGDTEPELVEEVDEHVAERIENLQNSGRTLDEVRKLQIKLLTRRAKAKTEVGGWASLQGADEDYRILLSPAMLPFLSPTDRRSAMEAARKLGPRLNEAKDREMAEMMDKLKGLGNSILKPFGLSTSNFQFKQDAKTGGYSMNFEQNPGK